jgi:hypothetical protein
MTLPDRSALLELYMLASSPSRCLLLSLSLIFFISRYPCITTSLSLNIARRPRPVLLRVVFVDSHSSIIWPHGVSATHFQTTRQFYHAYCLETDCNLLHHLYWITWICPPRSQSDQTQDFFLDCLFLNFSACYVYFCDPRNALALAQAATAPSRPLC